ncbi:free fatty acid receptor 2-like [Chanos chanos]|uniref:Free fatty acid receptor 2-like n=1 Tax=Chanos chanos TaxID=29144 RepID=A0A6J2W4N2_CHACN|nr:free fatty acid receptor 2-like [Chanos chanos]
MATYHVILSVYVLTFLIGMPANLLAFYAFVRKVLDKPTPTDVLLLNLTVSDLLFLFFLPLKMYEASNNMEWNLPRFLCSITTFVFFSTIYTSSLLLMAVSVDRYLCVAHPLQYKVRRKPLHGVIGCVIIWVTSTLHLCFIYIVEQPEKTSSAPLSSEVKHCYDNFTQEQLNVVLPMRLELCIVLYFIPLVVCTFCYFRFIFILNRASSLHPGKKKRAVGMAVGTLLVFVVCFMPYNITHVQGFITWNNVPWRSEALLLTTINTILDPVTFYFSSTAFQSNLKNLLSFKSKSGSTGNLMNPNQINRDIEGQANHPAVTISSDITPL